ncbi:YncE family protein [bacterium]|nr:YncE family protein [bacterium]
MKRTLLFLTLTAALAISLAGCSGDPLSPDTTTPAIGAVTQTEKASSRSKIVVANRGSGTISVLDAHSGAILGTYDLPQAEGDLQPEPMYVNEVRGHRRVFVGDRANDRVAVFDSRTFEVIGTVPAGRGVFHQWVNRTGDQLWVNNDIDNTITVIDPASLTVLATVALPADLVAMGGKPHDVILGPHGRHAFVTMVGFMGENDYLVRYDTSGFAESGRLAVGKDPHVSIGPGTMLYVPCQNTDQVLVVDHRSLEIMDELMIPGAHGATMSRNGKRFYTTNLPGSGIGALYTVDTRGNEILGDPVDTPYPVPHNLAVTPDGRRLFVTHSGGDSDKVTFYRLAGSDRLPVYLGETTVGLNPFGIGLVN